MENEHAGWGDSPTGPDDFADGARRVWRNRRGVRHGRRVLSGRGHQPGLNAVLDCHHGAVGDVTADSNSANGTSTDGRSAHRGPTGHDPSPGPADADRPAGGGTCAGDRDDDAGAALAAGSNGRTLYTYDSDTAGSGQTACNAGCVNEWPPLIVPHGTMASVGPGVTGRLGTIVRGDGTTQVTYNGLALYFYAGDSGPDQTHGAYPGWSLTKP